MRSRSLLQGIFPTQGSNWGLLHCRQILYHLSHPERQIQYKLVRVMIKCEHYKNNNLTLELSSAIYQLWKFSLFLRSSVFLLIGPTWGLIDKMVPYIDLTKNKSQWSLRLTKLPKWLPVISLAHILSKLWDHQIPDLQLCDHFFREFFIAGV